VVCSQAWGPLVWEVTQRNSGTVRFFLHTTMGFLSRDDTWALGKDSQLATPRSLSLGRPFHSRKPWKPPPLPTPLPPHSPGRKAHWPGQGSGVPRRSLLPPQNWHQVDAHRLNAVRLWEPLPWKPKDARYGGTGLSFQQFRRWRQKMAGSRPAWTT
jgi:hypothetical protein